MKKKGYSKKEAREILAELCECRSFLNMFGMITDAESEKIHFRIRKWQDKNEVSVSDAQLNSVEFVYNDKAVEE